ncbi:hypothetical protein AGMMS49940_16550 [Spirochaetia bacterium]|nr:hypothetical protein AGMMS49940_16550 [Spirochaetia bacterium]
MKRKIFEWLVIAAIVMAFVGCTSTPEGTTTIRINEADFKSDANGILTINNYTSFDVAIFAGKIERGNYLGAIKAGGGRSFDISKLPSMGRSRCLALCLAV